MPLQKEDVIVVYVCEICDASSEHEEWVGKPHNADFDKLHNIVIIDKTINHLTSTFTKAFEKTCPIRSKKKSKWPKWWNNQVHDLRIITNMLFNTSKSSEICWDGYRLYLKLYKSAVRTAKN